MVEKKKICKVIELKDGDAFDTKKSQGEKEHLEKFASLFGAKIPFSTEYYICCFNQNDKNKIYEGFKKTFPLQNIMIGKEICEALHIDYEEIIKIREKDMADNFNYFIEELVKIPEVREKIKSLLN